MRAVNVEQSIFLAALELQTPAERAAYLNGACGADAALRSNVQELLAVHEKGDDFLDRPPLAATTNEPTISERPGTRIGPYKLLEQIGEGGFGAVFMAEQLEPVRRMVALKVIKPGMDSKQVVARFEAERQALAMMDHPNIAKVLGAGATDAGRPYFVMELVRGIPITDYCDQAGFSVRVRLQLFVQVCRAVQHAHTKGVIHRDLKPGNVLVTSHDGVPVPYVIDFGVAKALGQQLSERTVHTGFAQMIGTPLYMSPEQAELNKLGVDTRSDIYSLGVLLYELLTGATPFDKERLRTVDFDEMRRILREEEPPRPSTRLSTLGAALSTVSERRGVDPRKLTQTLQGELDWILLKALEKDRNRRYETASAFAADVERYLNDEAVEACPPSALYRIRKFARRNKVALATTGLVAAALLIGTAFSIWQAIEATAAHELADNRLENEKQARHDAEKDRKLAEAAKREAGTKAAIAEAVNNFLLGDLLGQFDSVPQISDAFGGNSDLTVSEAIDRAAAKIGERFQDQPLVEAAIQQTVIGKGYARLGRHQLALAHFERAVTLRKALLGPDHPDTLASMDHLPGAYRMVARHSDAIALCQQLLEYRTARLGPDHPETLACATDLSEAYMWAGRQDKSVPLLEQTVEKMRAICGPTHPLTLSTMHNLAWHYCEVDRLAESMALHQKVLDTINFTNGAKQKPPIWVMMTYAQACQRAGKLDRADRLLREALEQNQKRKDSIGNRLSHANILGWLALNLLLQEQYHEAEPLIQQAVATFEKRQPGVFRGFFWVAIHGAVLSGQQRYAEAEPLLLKGYEGMKQGITYFGIQQGSQLAQAGEWVVQFYEMTNQPERARAWREKVQSPVPPK